MEVASTPTPAPTTDPTANPSVAGKAKKPYPWWKNKKKKPYDKPSEKKDTAPKTGGPGQGKKSPSDIITVSHLPSKLCTIIISTNEIL